jgi:hypothetical protein
VDPARIEAFLSASDFERVFGATKVRPAMLS